jgi:hypothetical protein
VNARVLFLAGSLALNAALAAIFAARPALAPASLRPYLPAAHGGDATPAPKTAHPIAAPAKHPTWPTIATDDMPTLIARLRALGFPASLIREIVAAEVSARYDARLRALREGDANTPFWKLPSTSSYAGGSKRMEEYSQIQRERSKVLRDLFTDPFFASDDITAGQRRQFGNLPRQKIDQLQRIEDDYAEMTSTIRSAMRGIMLASDREKLALLERERRLDLGTVLTPQELADYEVRSSPITGMLSQQLGGFRPSEAEFRAIFAAQVAMNQRFPAIASSTDFEQRNAAQRELNAQLRTALGDTRYTDYLRETSYEYQQLNRLAQRENIPADTAARAYNMRDSVSSESMRIYGDAALTPDQKRTALVALAQSTRAQLLALLGTAGPQYVAMVDNQYLSMVERGNAVTFDGGPNMTISDGTTMISLGASGNFRSVPSSRPPPPPGM